MESKKVKKNISYTFKNNDNKNIKKLFDSFNLDTCKKLLSNYDNIDNYELKKILKKIKSSKYNLDDLYSIYQKGGSFGDPRGRIQLRQANNALRRVSDRINYEEISMEDFQMFNTIGNVFEKFKKNNPNYVRSVDINKFIKYALQEGSLILYKELNQNDDINCYMETDNPEGKKLVVKKNLNGDKIFSSDRFAYLRGEKVNIDCDGNGDKFVKYKNKKQYNNLVCCTEKNKGIGGIIDDRREASQRLDEEKKEKNELVYLKELKKLIIDKFKSRGVSFKPLNFVKAFFDEKKKPIEQADFTKVEEFDAIFNEYAELRAKFEGTLSNNLKPSKDYFTGNRKDFRKYYYILNAKIFKIEKYNSKNIEDILGTIWDLFYDDAVNPIVGTTEGEPFFNSKLGKLVNIASKKTLTPEIFISYILYDKLSYKNDQFPEQDKSGEIDNQLLEKFTEYLNDDYKEDIEGFCNGYLDILEKLIKEHTKVDNDFKKDIFINIMEEFFGVKILEKPRISKNDLNEYLYKKKIDLKICNNKSILDNFKSNPISYDQSYIFPNFQTNTLPLNIQQNYKSYPNQELFYIPYNIDYSRYYFPNELIYYGGMNEGETNEEAKEADQVPTDNSLDNEIPAPTEALVSDDSAAGADVVSTDLANIAANETPVPTEANNANVVQTDNAPDTTGQTVMNTATNVVPDQTVINGPDTATEVPVTNLEPENYKFGEVTFGGVTLSNNKINILDIKISKSKSYDDKGEAIINTFNFCKDYNKVKFFDEYDKDVNNCKKLWTDEIDKDNILINVDLGKNIDAYPSVNRQDPINDQFKVLSSELKLAFDYPVQITEKEITPRAEIIGEREDINNLILGHNNEVEEYIKNLENKKFVITNDNLSDTAAKMIGNIENQMRRVEDMKKDLNSSRKEMSKEYINMVAQTLKESKDSVNERAKQAIEDVRSQMKSNADLISQQLQQKSDLITQTMKNESDIVEKQATAAIQAIGAFSNDKLQIDSARYDFAKNEIERNLNQINKRGSSNNKSSRQQGSLTLFDGDNGEYKNLLKSCSNNADCGSLLKCSSYNSSKDKETFLCQIPKNKACRKVSEMPEKLKNIRERNFLDGNFVDEDFYNYIEILKNDGIDFDENELVRFQMKEDFKLLPTNVNQCEGSSKCEGNEIGAKGICKGKGGFGSFLRGGYDINYSKNAIKFKVNYTNN